jgi:uncharacterized protein YukE
MLGSFLPPVVFEVTANATQAMATFKGINTQLSLMEAQALKTGKAISGFSKAAIAGTKVFKYFGASLALAAGIGIKMAMDLEKSLSRLGQTLNALGLSTAENRKQIGLLVDSYEELGFGSEDAADAYGRLITMTKDVETSNRLLAMSADLARARTMSLEAAASLLARAQMGNTRVFRQFGITLDDTKPKAQAIEEAMGKLEARLSGQALAYTKTFAGQLAVLNESLGDIFETIGFRLLPILNALLEKIKGTGKFMKDYAKEIEAAATAITILLIPAMVNFTKKLVLMTAAMLKAPWVRVALLIYAIAYAFNRAEGEAKSFAKIFGGVADWFLATVGTMVNGVENFVQAFMYFSKAGLLAKKTYQDLKGDKAGAAATQKELDQWEKEYRAIDNWTGSIEKARGKIREFQANYKGFKLETIIPEIPGFGNSDFVDDTTGGINGLSEALINATQRVKDFNEEIKTTFLELKNNWGSIVGKDFNAAIQEGLLNPIDKLVAKTKTAVTAYQAASSQYQSALSTLTSAQTAYTNAVKSGNKAIIASTDSALKRAEALIKGLQASMGSALADIAQLQQEMIDAVIEAENKITELKADRKKVVEDGLKAELDLQKEYNSKIAQLQKDAADRSAEIVKQSVDQLRGVFKSATYRGLGDIYSGLTFEGKYLAGGSLENITKALATQAQKATSLADKAGKLQALGFTQTFIEEVIAQGPDIGGALADTILAGSPESVNQLQTYWSALEKITLHGVDNVAKKLNSGMTLATEELTAQLASVQTELTSALSDAYKEYSDSLTEIRAKTAEQIKLIDDQITQLLTRIAQLKVALADLANLNTPGTQKTPTAATGFERLGTDIGSLSPKLMEAVVSNANSYKVAEDTRLQALASGQSQSDAATAARWTGQAVKYFQDQLASANQAGVTVNITANTNASAEQIAKDTAWAIRTSGDVQYNVTSGTNRRMAGID